MKKPSVSEYKVFTLYRINVPRNSETLHPVQRYPFNEFILHVFQNV